MTMSDTQTLQSSPYSGSMSSLESTSTSWSQLEDTTPTSKALFINTSLPAVYHKHHVRITNDQGFSTILKEDERTTVRDVIGILHRKFGFKDDIKVCLWVGDNQVVLNDEDRIVEIQNEIFREMWIEEEQLPIAGLSWQTYNFKFVVL